jgi:ATP-dependent Clp protease ATP-binding subunit ClpC
MVERFTERARRVMVLATEEARRRRHASVGSEHLLLGILREGQCLDPKVLKRLRVSAEMLQAEAERALGAPPAASSIGELAFSSELKGVLAMAFDLTRRPDGSIGPEHLLLGLLAEDGPAGRVLRGAGADFEAACRMGFVVPGGERGFLLATSPWLAKRGPRCE